jgi:hypothetical protein
MIAAGYRDSSNPSNIASIMFERAPSASGASSAGSIVFGAMANGTTGIPTERMRLDSSGNVGIGTASPVNKLSIESSGTASSEIDISLVSGTSNKECILNFGKNLATSDRYLGRIFYQVDNNVMGFWTNNTERMSTTYGQRAGSLVLESNNTTGGGGTDVVWSTGTETNERYASIGSALVGNDASGSRGNIVFATKAASATTTLTERMSIATSGTVNVVGTFTAGTKTFRIDHPLPEKTDTHYLLHSSIEGPKADLIYRGRANLVSGTVDVNIDIAAGMTDGTFEVLCDDVQCFTSNEDGWTALKGSVTGNILTITAQDNTCTDIVSWLVIGERKDAKMIESEWADADGKLIVEALKSEHE